MPLSNLPWRTKPLQDRLVGKVIVRPRRIELLADERVVKVAAGYQHSLCVLASKQVWGFGNNTYGQLGAEDRQSIQSNMAFTFEPDSIACGAFHSAIVFSDGGVRTFGWGLYHQLGHDVTEDVCRPKLVTALEGLQSRVKMVACGAWHTVALTHSGDLYAWGWNRDGQLGIDSQTLSIASLPQLISHDGYFDADGLGHEVVDVGCGNRHTSALCANGDLLTWGDQQCKLHPATQFTRIQCGDSYTIGY